MAGLQRLFKRDSTGALWWKVLQVVKVPLLASVAKVFALFREPVLSIVVDSVVASYLRCLFVAASTGSEPLCIAIVSV